MARKININRAEAEYLVDLLEAQPEGPGEHYLALDIAAALREAFGMVTREDELRLKGWPWTR